jgi:hypothetical protein
LVLVVARWGLGGEGRKPIVLLQPAVARDSTTLSWVDLGMDET